MDTSMAPVDECIALVDKRIALDANARAMSRLQFVAKYLAPPPTLRPFPFARYGRTRALILDFYKAEDGTIRKRTNPAKSTYADAVCNRIDSNWALARQQRADENTAMLEQDDYTVESPATCAPAKSTLGAYQGFKILYKERKRCRRYPPVSSAVGFLDLPAELRNPLYRQWLVSSKPIHVCCSHRKDYSVHPSTWSDHIPTTGLMRLNQQICTEASSIYYGENDLQFLDTDGWLTLRDFLQAIGSTNTSYIRHLTVHTHWFLNTHEYIHYTGNCCNDGDYRYFDETDVAAAVEECFELLSKAGSLVSLTLVLPADLHYYHVWPLPSNLPKLRIKLIRSECQHLHNQGKHSNPVVEKTEQLQGGYGSVEVLRVFDTPQSYARHQGWEYEECGNTYCKWNR